jgi:hypothetical protein
VEHHECICLGNGQRGREVVSMVVFHDGYFQHFLLPFSLPYTSDWQQDIFDLL